STSWRNGHAILDVANTIVAPFASRSEVERLEPSERATRVPVETRFLETVADEATAAAAWLRARLAEHSREGVPPSAAMLFRTRSTQSFFLQALREHGVPFHVLGVGGLLAEPEVADLVCALTVVH